MFVTISLHKWAKPNENVHHTLISFHNNKRFNFKLKPLYQKVVILNTVVQETVDT